MKQTFGKGLASLIPKKTSKGLGKTANKREAVFWIEIEKIKSNPYQPRKEFGIEHLESLAESIRDYGILQPLIVTKNEKETSGGSRTEYQLIAGERRLMAARMVGLNQVPIIIKEPQEREKLEVSLIENVQRLDLNPIEKGEAFKRLYEEFGMSQKEIARKAGMSKEAVSNTVRLLELPEEIKEAVKQGKTSEGHARAILGAKAPKARIILFHKVLKDDMNVRETEYAVQKINVWKPSLRQKISKEASDEIKILEEKLRKGLGVKSLRLKIEKDKPKLLVLFRSKQEIEELLKKFNV